MSTCSQKVHQMSSTKRVKIEPNSITYGFKSFLKTRGKLKPKTVSNSWRNGSPKRAQMWAKIIKKGSSEHALSLLGALGRTGGPRNHKIMDLGLFLMDCRKVFSGYGRLSFVYPGYIFLSCAITLYDTFRFLLVSTGIYSGKRQPDVEGFCKQGSL